MIQMYKKRLKGNDIESSRSVIPRESDRSGQEGRKEGRKDGEEKKKQSNRRFPPACESCIPVRM